METKTRTRTTEPKLYRVEGPGSAVHVVKALTKAGAVNAVADMIVSEPLSAVEAVELGIAPDRIIDATVQPVRYPLPRALVVSGEPGPGAVFRVEPEGAYATPAEG